MTDIPKPQLPSSSTDTNPFGGKNPMGLYVPMSEDEQEVLARLASESLVLIVHGWCQIENPRFIFGDLRVQVGPFRLDFLQPAAPTPVYFFDLELQRWNGQSVFKQRMPLPHPVQVCNGVFLDLIWDIAIDHMDPQFVKDIKTGAIGLTSRRIDKDTRERTFQGNMDLDADHKKLLGYVETGAAEVRADDAAQAMKATQAAGYKVKETAKGYQQ